MTILFGFYLAKTFSQAFGTIWLTNAIQHSMRDLRSAMMNKIRKLPVRYFDSHHYGDVLSRITNDIDAISNALQQSVLQVLSGIFNHSYGIVYDVFNQRDHGMYCFYDHSIDFAHYAICGKKKPETVSGTAKCFGRFKWRYYGDVYRV